jgi:hypothetical protein
MGANLLTNGSFEADPDGTTITGSDFHNVGGITAWRAFAVAGGAATMQVTSAAASEGAKGIMLARDNALGDSALDLDHTAVRVPIPTQPRVYKFLVDVRDGGTYGGSPRFALGTQFPGGVGGVQNRTFVYDPGAQFEKIGLTAVSNTSGYLSTRFDLGATAGRSVYLDNAQVIDVTSSDRTVNGGFENSGSRLLGWRFFAVSGATRSATVSADAATGTRAALLSRTSTAGDLGLDLWDTDKRLGAIGGETIQVSMKAKQVSGVDTGLGWNVSTFDAAGNFLGDAFGTQVKPGTAAYTTYSTGNVTLGANVAFVSVGFRIWGPGGGPGIGSYLIDDVAVVPEPAAALLLAAAGLLLARRRRA